MGEDATWGRTTISAFARRAVPAAAVGHAVSLGQLADPVGQLRRGGRLAGGLRLRLHAGAGRRRLPAGDVPHLRRRHGVGQRRARAAGGLRRRPARRRRPRGGCGRRWTRRATGSPTSCATPTRSLRSIRAGDHPEAGGLVVAIDKEHAREARRPAGADHRRAAGHRAFRRGGRLGADRALLGRLRALAGVGADGLRGRRRPAPAGRRVRHDRPHGALLPPGDRALHPPHAGRPRSR